MKAPTSERARRIFADDEAALKVISAARKGESTTVEVDGKRYRVQRVSESRSESRDDNSTSDESLHQAMNDRRVYDVSPDGEGGWDVKRRGRDRATRNFDNKDEAIESARGHAKNADEGQIVIRGRDGRIQREHTYESDPERREG